MEQGSIVSFWFATLLYAAATVLYVYYFVDKRQRLSWYATFATGAGFLMHTASIGLRWAQRGSFPLAGPYESLLIAAWAVIVIYFVVEHASKVKTLGGLLVGVAAVAMVIAWLNFHAPAGQDQELLENWRVWIHVVIIMLANAGLMIGAVSSVLYLVQESQLKSHRTNLFFRRLPSLASTDRLSRKAIAWAFPAYTAAILIGTINAVEFLEGAWYGDLRVLLAFVVWFIFGGYLLLRSRSRVGGRVAAWIAVVGLVAVVALSIIARTVPSGFHIFGV